MYFSYRPAPGKFATARVSRKTTNDVWGSRTLFDQDGTNTERVYVWPSPDETSVTYAQLTPTGGVWKLFTARLRADKTVDATTVQALTALNGPGNDLTPYLAPDQSEVWWESDRPSGNNVFDVRARRIRTLGLTSSSATSRCPAWTESR